jgi:hypothetical protein
MENGHSNRIETLLENLQATVLVAIDKIAKFDAESRERDLRLSMAFHKLAADQADGQRRMEARHDVLLGRVDKIELRLGNLEDKVTALDVKVAALDAKVTALDVKVVAFEVFAGDTTRRLERIESNLQLNGTPRSASGNN